MGLRPYVVALGGAWKKVVEWGVARDEIVPEDEVADVKDRGVPGLQRVNLVLEC